MKIHLDFKPDHVLMTTPGLATSDPLRRALTCGYAGMVLDLTERMQIFDSNQPAAFELPLPSWRHFLRHLKHVFDVNELRASRKRADQVPQKMLFVTGGQTHAREDDIPPQPDIDVDIADAFEISGPEMLVIDACHHDVNKHGLKLLALPGRWRTRVRLRDRSNGFDIVLLAVAHESAGVPSLEREAYGTERGKIGIETHECGFFDAVRYPLEPAQHAHEKGTFYVTCRDAAECRADFVDIPRALPIGAIPGGWGLNARMLSGTGYNRVFARQAGDGRAQAVCVSFHYHDPAFGQPQDD